MNLTDAHRELHYLAFKRLAKWVRSALPDAKPCLVMTSNHKTEECLGCSLAEVDRYDPDRKVEEFPCAPV